MKRTFIRDMLFGLILGVSSSAWLGYLVGLRILNWNPTLWLECSNVWGVLIFSTLLYTIVGILVSLLFTLGLKIIFSLLPKLKKSGVFPRLWISLYSLLNILLFAFLTITRTRPGVHVLIFDTLLVLVYVLSLLILYWIIWVQIDKPRFHLLKAVFIPISAYVVITFVLVYFATPKQSPPVKGNIEQIESAFAEVRSGVKTAIFGLDGLEWTVVDRLISEGRMPVTAGLINRGVRADFLSLNTLKSPLIWTSMATGKTPDKHGIQDFGSFQFPLMKSSFINYPDGIGFYRLVSTLIPHSDLPVTSTTRKVEAVWDILSKAGKTVGVAAWWATWPADSVNGWMISDRFTYSLFNSRQNSSSLKEGQTYPPDLLDRIAGFARLPESMTDTELSKFVEGNVNFIPGDWTASGRDEWNPMYQLKTGYTAGESYAAASMELVKENQPDFFTIYFEGSDMVSHFFWQYMDDSLYPEELDPLEKEAFKDVVPNYYCYLDSMMGVFIQYLDPETDIIVVSDHGFQPVSDPVIPYRGGDHKPQGVFIAAGPSFKQSVRIAETSVLDLTPTLLYLYGLPSAGDMDGKIMTDAFSEEYLQAHPQELITSYETGRRTYSSLTSSSVDDAVKEQLKSLGYTK